MVDSFDTTIVAAERAGVRFDDASPPASQRIRQNDEFELHFIDWGDESGTKPALIFIHGFPSASQNVGLHMPRLALPFPMHLS